MAPSGSGRSGAGEPGTVAPRLPARPLPRLGAALPGASLLQALAQLDDPAFVAVLLRSLLWSALAFALLFGGSVWGAHRWLAAHGHFWLGGTGAWLGGAAGGVAAAVLAVFLFLPVAVLIATFSLESIALAVERASYPGLPAPRGAPLAVQAWDGIAFAGLLLALNAVALLLAVLLPGVGLALGWAIAAWAIGRGLFVAVAMRRMGLDAARAAYRRRRGAVLLNGAVLAAAGSVPGLNLLVPVLGVAAMVHVLNDRPGTG